MASVPPLTGGGGVVATITGPVYQPPPPSLVGTIPPPTVLLVVATLKPVLLPVLTPEPVTKVDDPGALIEPSSKQPDAKTHASVATHLIGRMPVRVSLRRGRLNDPRLTRGPSNPHD